MLCSNIQPKARHGMRMELAMNKSKWQTRKLSPLLYAAQGALLCAMLAGCNVGPKYMPPAVTAPAAYKESPEQFKEAGDEAKGAWTVARPQDAALRGNWW